MVHKRRASYEAIFYTVFYAVFSSLFIQRQKVRYCALEIRNVDISQKIELAIAKALQQKFDKTAIVTPKYLETRFYMS